MKETQPVCLAYYGLAYYGIPSLAHQVIEDIARYAEMSIGDVVEMTAEDLAQGSVSPGILPYSCVLLAVHADAPEEIEEDCLNYLLRTLGKTVGGVASIAGREETQQTCMFHARPGWRMHRPTLQSDGVHWTVELLREDEWELMEAGWESPNHFVDEGEAEVVARNLVLRHDGMMRTRVVSPRGVVLTTFRLQKFLVTGRRGLRERREELSPQLPVPMLHMAREGYQASKAGRSTS
ncbi:hypothetical protein KSF_107210 [Reticulibacter mediterranei]|uniref:Uncharacterized protein n=1 Tax=Reticulibacter mediterranei TaxID=2778369 RepID=A0A8J3N9D9_9CHLR|nr:hypothetical protein [Reticulibacter mediterranei]GHP00674.1 hypothetical protein KSF_107210 [Reticulibacter mediterranei]